MNRSCHRHTTDLARPVPRMIALVPRPSAVSRMMFARQTCFCGLLRFATTARMRARSEEHTSELQSRPHLVCRLLLEKKNNNKYINMDGKIEYYIYIYIYFML